MNRSQMVIVSLCGLLVVGCQSMDTPTDSAASPGAVAEISFDGMQLKNQDSFDEVYVSPEFSWQDYDSIMLEPGTVAFKKNWVRDYNFDNRANQIRERDLQDIRDRMSKYIYEEFEKVLGAKSPLPIVTEAGVSTLMLKPSIINLDINAPDVPTANRQYTYTESAGEATLYLELIDSVSGKALARVVDRQKDRDDNYFTWRNRATNAQDAKRISETWAERFVELLGQVEE